jgi:hypothetical protein
MKCKCLTTKAQGQLYLISLSGVVLLYAELLRVVGSDNNIKHALALPGHNGS